MVRFQINGPVEFSASRGSAAGIHTDWVQIQLVGGWTNPFERYARQIGSFPQIEVKIKNIWNHHLANVHPSDLSNSFFYKVGPSSSYKWRSNNPYK